MRIAVLVAATLLAAPAFAGTAKLASSVVTFAESRGHYRISSIKFGFIVAPVCSRGNMGMDAEREAEVVESMSLAAKHRTKSEIELRFEGEFDPAKVCIASAKAVVE